MKTEKEVRERMKMMQDVYEDVKNHSPIEANLYLQGQIAILLWVLDSEV